ncbi:MAG: AMP-binding protein [Nitratireductor sp.]|nr:AMP-binding protein [Nitratireductor sp.]
MGGCRRLRRTGAALGYPERRSLRRAQPELEERVAPIDRAYSQRPISLPNLPPTRHGRAISPVCVLPGRTGVTGKAFSSQIAGRLAGHTLFSALVDAAGRYGSREPQLEDAVGQKFSYGRILLGARLLAKRFEKVTQAGEIVAVLLPNANAVVSTFFALQSAGRVPAMLNYTAGPAIVVSACRTVKARLVIASRQFIEKAELNALQEALEAAGLDFFWLEDLADDVGLFEKLCAALFARRALARPKPDDPALVLFTSGSEGHPKAVVLSHGNLLSNCAQIAERIAFGPQDKLFNVLPVFHSFGITGGMVLPLMFGVKLFLYPSPLHMKIIPQVVAKTRPTILFGTDTFLTGYARAAKDSDFASLRLVVAGAEAVREETYRTWAERFDTLVLEGFGMTEAAPVVAVNTPDERKPGSVGKLLPGIEARLEPVDGIEKGGRLWLRGPNVMLGYMTHDRPGELQPPGDGWHDSGDIVEIDENGFVTIRGRAKRFAKVAGEMVSLGAIEMMVSRLWPQANHAAVALPDKRKGEKIVLVTTWDAADKEPLVKAAREQGYTELMVPNIIIKVAEIPVLGSGKTDYVTAQKLAGERAIR